MLPAPGGDVVRDGAGVLPTGRNIHALDPYRIPSAAAMVRGRTAATLILEAHRKKGMYVQVTLFPVHNSCVLNPSVYSLFDLSAFKQETSLSYESFLLCTIDSNTSICLNL